MAWRHGGVKIFHVLLTLYFIAPAASQEPPPIDFIKINCGGSALEDVGFLADEDYFSTSSTVETASVYNPEAPLAPIPWAMPYQSYRYAFGGILEYRLPVPDGVYSVSLMFAEQHDGAAHTGGRVMDLFINSVLLDKGIDVWTLAGESLNTPYFLQKTDISAVDGYIKIGLVPVVENPMISGIVIQGNNAASILWNTQAPGAHETSPENHQPVSVIETVVITATTTPTTAVPATTQALTQEPVEMSATTPPSTTAAVAELTAGDWRNEMYSFGQPIARHEACAVMAEGQIYLIGGRGIKDTSVYNPGTGVWTIAPGPPVEINHIQCVYYQGRIWIGGSWFGAFPREREHTEIYVYDIAKSEWSTEPGPAPERRRGGGAFVAYQDKLYLSHGAIGGHGPHANTTGFLDEFDPLTQTWTELPDAPNPRDHTTGAVINDMLCVAGGRDGGTADFWNSNVAPVDCYNFATGTWSVLADLPDPRGGTMVGTTCDGRLMVAGGEGKSPVARDGMAYARVDLLNVQSNTWDEPTYMTSARHGSGLAITSCECGKIFVPSGSAGLGGGPEVITTDVWTNQPWQERCV